MKIDLKKPVFSSLFSISITFLVSMIVLCVTNPTYITEVSKKGKKKKNVYLLFTYSMLFATLVGTIVLLWRTGSNIRSGKSVPVLAFNTRAYRPNAY
jgi:hypothetical protein